MGWRNVSIMPHCRGAARRVECRSWTPSSALISTSRFDAVDRRFDAVDGRFDTVDRRFNAVDGRFDAVDDRFDALDQRFGAADQRIDGVDQRLDTVDRRFVALETEVRHSGVLIEQVRHEVQVVAEMVVANTEAITQLRRRLDAR